MKAQVGPGRTRGCEPAAHTPRNLDPREAGWGPTCDCLLSLAPQPAAAAPIHGSCPPACRSPCATAAGDPGAHTPVRLRPYHVFGRKRMAAVSPNSAGSGDVSEFRLRILMQRSASPFVISNAVRDA